MGRQENIDIFENTRKLCRTEPDLIAAIKESNNLQRVILESEKIETVPPIYKEPARITVSRKRSFEAALEHPPYQTCVLNFASATNPGGGVTKGSSAQEECLCRCSTLYANLSVPKLWKPFYEAHRKQNNPLYNDDCIYTPDVVVFKSDTANPELLNTEDWWVGNVITCAAPNLRPDRDGRVRVRIGDRDLYQLHVKRMRRILNIAALMGNENMILGAYGCGAFQNPPEVVARAMKQVVEEFRYCFRAIEFAVYCSPRDDTNYRVFQRIIG